MKVDLQIFSSPSPTPSPAKMNFKSRLKSKSGLDTTSLIILK